MFRRLTLLLLTLMLVACAPITPAPAPTPMPDLMVSSTDSFGHVVKLKGPAQRIVSLAPSNTEIVFAVGAGAQLAGRDDFSDYPAEAAPVPSIGSLYPQANAEAIVALKPDLILAAGITSPDEIKKLEGLGLTIYVTSFANTLDDIYGDIRAIGALTGHAPEAEALVATMQTRAQAVTERVKDAEKPVVFYEIDATDPAKPWTAGPGSFIDQLLTLAGGVNAGGLASDPYPQLSLEQIAHQDPAVIILGSATFGGQTPELVAQRPGWGELSAVKNNRVFAFDDNLVSRPGPRVVDGLEALAKLIHPELFK